MNVLCIYGCGGLGREVADLAKRIAKWQSVLFVDDNRAGQVIDGIIVKTLETVLKELPANALEFIVAIGEPSVREKLYVTLEKKQLFCTNVIDPSFILSSLSSIDQGVVIHSGTTITTNVHIGKGCFINKHVVIGHDVNVGAYSVISPQCTIGGNVEIGSNCFLGSGANIRNGISIGKQSIVGMGSVVLKNVAPRSVVIGNPARLLRENKDYTVFQ